MAYFDPGWVVDLMWYMQLELLLHPICNLLQVQDLRDDLLQLEAEARQHEAVSATTAERRVEKKALSRTKCMELGLAMQQEHAA